MEGNAHPNQLHDAEGPGTGKEAVGAREEAAAGEGEE